MLSATVASTVVVSGGSGGAFGGVHRKAHSLMHATKVAGGSDGQRLMHLGSKPPGQDRGDGDGGSAQSGVRSVMNVSGISERQQRGAVVDVRECRCRSRRSAQLAKIERLAHKIERVVGWYLLGCLVGMLVGVFGTRYRYQTSTRGIQPTHSNLAPTLILRQ